eukprot:7377188-Prymnesium_polylepis.7
MLEENIEELKKQNSALLLRSSVGDSPKLEKADDYDCGGEHWFRHAMPPQQHFWTWAATTRTRGCAAFILITVRCRVGRWPETPEGDRFTSSDAGGLTAGVTPFLQIASIAIPATA